MNKFTLTMLDTTGIQDYIFNSNRLQENIGASELVYRATTLWAFEALDKAVKKSHNIKPPQNLQLEFTDAEIEKDSNLQAEVIQAAGGNTIILFRDETKSREFVRILTRRLLEEAPGLTVLAQHDDKFEFSSTKLSEAQKTLEANMRAHKLSRLPSAPTLGLSVTAMCDSTGLAAVNTLAGRTKVEGELKSLSLDGEDTTALVSSETAAKRVWRDQANQRLRIWLKPAADKYKFPFDLEKIGRIKGDESYVAVIHADGNKMGEKVKGIAQDVAQKFSGQPVEIINREYIRAMREFSKKVNDASLAALNAVVGLTVQAVKNKAIPFETDKKDGTPYLPLRPLVFGGDDVTFVCNGSIGVELAATYLKVFHDEARELDLHACAGVSIVKMHYPFARAYKLSEELAGSAKSLTREEDCSALDWHFAQSGLSGSLESIREQEYSVQESSVKSILEEKDLKDVEEKNKKFMLTMRPLRLLENVNGRHWYGEHGIEKLIETFRNKKPWVDSHNKILGLREELRKGTQAVERYLLDFGLEDLPTIIPGSERHGWYKSKTPLVGASKENRKLECRCVYFDAIELLDHHIALNTKKESQ